MLPRIWATSHTGRFIIKSMTPETLKQATDIMRNSFFKEELVSKCIGVPSCPKSIAELVDLSAHVAKDGVSLVATDSVTGKVATVMFNKIMQRNEESIFEKYLKISKEESSKAFLQFMVDTDASIDVFDHQKSDCGIEFMFVGTNPEYRQMSLGTEILNVTLDLAKALSKGQNVKVPIDNNVLSLQPVPTFAFAMCTTTMTKNVIKKLGFTILNEVKYDDCYYKGTSFGSKVGHVTKSFTLNSYSL